MSRLGFHLAKTQITARSLPVDGRDRRRHFIFHTERANFTKSRNFLGQKTDSFNTALDSTFVFDILPIRQRLDSPIGTSPKIILPQIIYDGY